jgi:hypothetical protein
MNYELAVTFRTNRPLTDSEVTDLLNRFGLEIDEPTTTGDDGMPTDAEWSGRNVRMVLVDDSGRQVGSWLW